MDQHAHSGEHTHDFRDASRRSLWIAFALTAGYMLAEVLGGFLANSLALLADAGHMVTDVMAIGLSLLAIWIAGRPASARFSFGFQRAEVLAALLNVVSLWLISVWIFIEAYRRFQAPPDVQGPLMLSVGFIGLLVNIAAAWVLQRSAGKSLNVEAAFLHVLGDLLGSIAVVIGGLLIIAFGWFVVDPLFGVVIGLLILFNSSRLLWKVVHVLAEGTPHDINLRSLCLQLEQAEGVTGVHDIHVWSLTTGYSVMSAHVTSDELVERERLLQRLRTISRELGITHATIQLEGTQDGCEEVHHVEHGSKGDR